jgi:hypothetical protein
MTNHFNIKNELWAATVAALNNPQTVKVLATVDSNGVPHSAFKDSLRLRNDGLLEYNEIIETSHTNRNMVRAIWFGNEVSISLLTPDKKSYLIKGAPKATLISGREYRKRYEAHQNLHPDSDMGAVWLIEPSSIEETTLEKRRLEEDESHPLLRHLDRLIKKKPIHLET